ncbi:MAG: DUF2231 domain-containing protein [Chloroflexota bacterium]
MEFFDRLIRALTEVHPLHPMLVHFPIGLTGAAAFFILLALIYKSKVLEQAAFANIALATVATLAAGVTGIYDNSLTYDGDAPNATVKVTLATVLLILTTVTAVARWRNPNLFEKSRTIYTAAYFVSFGIAVVLAFLGGVILYGF